MLPQRWWTTLYIALVGAIVGVLIGMRAGSPVVGAVVGAASGALFSGVILAFFVSHDSRLISLRAKFPDAIVVQGMKDEDNSEPLIDIAVGQDHTYSVGRLFSMVFDTSGMTIWSGAREPVLLGSVPWHEVAGIGLGTSYTPPVRGATSYPRLSINLTIDGVEPELLAGIERVGRFGTSRFALNEGELIQLADRLEKLRVGRDTAPERAPLSYIIRPLGPAPSAWNLSRIGSLGIGAVNWLAQGVFLTGILSVLLHWPLVVTITLFALAIVASALYFLRLRQVGKASAREVAAGYTTLNSSNLAVEQVHPVSGRVIRAAGDRALTKQEFTEALRAG